ncbi:hypothetical protein I6G96_07120 [Delftia acidovorans]|uniref:hypothetical protein n=1 Tax=Delftia acidovorans TaxID=80866 RepID=UPI0018D9D8E6|nr:hypothetical protein [Delftia acidovorans]QPR36173.1 hypothetical protein I6G96_07120 [Delftia acidovorans]
MSTRPVNLSQQQHRIVEAQTQATKLEALRQAAMRGWSDVASGHYIDVPDEDFDLFIADLGRQAASRIKAGA